MLKPIIGVNMDFRAARQDAPAFCFLSAAYFESLERAGAIPVVLPPLESEADLGAVLNRLDGFLLVGGQDLDPRRDGFMLHFTTRLMDPRRETFDRALMRMLANRRLPTFGIGAGMQLLNVCQGGNLSLHIPEDIPGALPHWDAHDKGHRHGLE
ncbi:MAG: gamma-glutamyl-gamma-aminobutyrate hydrolase family protein, partial [Planctomycetales bacterium]|nr:gamma-glutamyl-gamma-aminobutyrate hydrolase family protein [Planctomycetales bacterium]